MLLKIISVLRRLRDFPHEGGPFNGMNRNRSRNYCAVGIQFAGGDFTFRAAQLGDVFPMLA